MFPTKQRCPNCGQEFEGSDAIGALCVYCEVNREIRIQQERIEEISVLRTRLIAADKLALTVAKAIMRGEIRERSAVDDALLVYLNIGGIEGPKDVPTWIQQYESEST